MKIKVVKIKKYFVSYLADVLFVFFKYNYLLIKEMARRPKHDQTCHNTSVAKRAAGAIGGDRERHRERVEGIQ